MLISRGLKLFKNVSGFTKQRIAHNKMPVRHSHGEVGYRDIPEPEFLDKFAAEAFGGLMWWWIFWHMWHDWDHIVGHFPYPEPEKWTDEELGIPPDDYD